VLRARREVELGWGAVRGGHGDARPRAAAERIIFSGAYLCGGVFRARGA
jgi:hypothetical protein